MCRSTRQRRQRSITIAATTADEENLTHDFLTTNATGMILIPTTTTTTTTYNRIVASSTPRISSATTYHPDNDEQEEEKEAKVEAKDDEGGGPTSSLNATSSMMMSSRVSSPPLEDAVMPLSQDEGPGGEEDDDHSDHDHNVESVVVTTPTKINHNTGDDYYFTAPLVTATRSDLVAKNDEQQEQTMNNKKAMKRVSIDERVQVRTTLARIEISPQERTAAWYSPEEYKEITEACCKQLKKLNRGEVFKDKKYCARGLEAYTRIHIKARKLNRLLAYEALWVEDERQVQSGIHNEEALARAYRAVSSSCQLWAQVIALEDQKEADNIADSF